jgi:hypothetical protein
MYAKSSEYRRIGPATVTPNSSTRVQHAAEERLAGLTGRQAFQRFPSDGPGEARERELVEIGVEENLVGDVGGFENGRHSPENELTLHRRHAGHLTLDHGLKPISDGLRSCSSCRLTQRHTRGQCEGKGEQPPQPQATDAKAKPSNPHN